MADTDTINAGAAQAAFVEEPRDWSWRAYVPGTPEWIERMEWIGQWYGGVASTAGDVVGEAAGAAGRVGGEVAEEGAELLEAAGRGLLEGTEAYMNRALVTGAVTVVAVGLGALLIWRLTQ